MERKKILGRAFGRHTSCEPRVIVIALCMSVEVNYKVRRVSSLSGRSPGLPQGEQEAGELF